jgi:hypothetical protein
LLEVDSQVKRKIKQGSKLALIYIKLKRQPLLIAFPYIVFTKNALPAKNAATKHY